MTVANLLAICWFGLGAIQIFLSVCWVLPCSPGFTPRYPLTVPRYPLIMQSRAATISGSPEIAAPEYHKTLQVNLLAACLRRTATKPQSAEARRLLEEMLALAGSRRDLPDAKARALLDCIARHCCPAVAFGLKSDHQWTDRRLMRARGLRDLHDPAASLDEERCVSRARTRGRARGHARASSLLLLLNIYH